MNNYMQAILNLYKKYKEFTNYIIVGIGTTIVSLLIYYISVLTILSPKNPLLLQIANIISWIGAVTFAYFANRKYVFKSNNNKLSEISKFYTGRITVLLIDMISMAIMVNMLNISDKIAKIIVQFIVVVLNYLISKFLVFVKNNANTNI